MDFVRELRPNSLPHRFQQAGAVATWVADGGRDGVGVESFGVPGVEHGCDVAEGRFGVEPFALPVQVEDHWGAVVPHGLGQGVRHRGQDRERAEAFAARRVAPFVPNPGQGERTLPVAG